MKTVQMYIPRRDILWMDMPGEHQTPENMEAFKTCYREALEALIQTAQQDDVITPILRMGKAEKRGESFFWSVTCVDIGRRWDGGQINFYGENTSQWAFGGGIIFDPLSNRIWVVGY